MSVQLRRKVLHLSYWFLILCGLVWIWLFRVVSRWNGCWCFRWVQLRRGGLCWRGRWWTVLLVRCRWCINRSRAGILFRCFNRVWLVDRILCGKVGYFRGFRLQEIYVFFWWLCWKIYDFCGRRGVDYRLVLLHWCCRSGLRRAAPWRWVLRCRLSVYLFGWLVTIDEEGVLCSAVCRDYS